MTIVIGLTGSIGMGKTTTARMFRFLKIPVFDADAQIHQMRMHDPLIVKALGQHFPKFHRQGKLDLPMLGEAAFNNPALLEKLEGVFYPELRRRLGKFLASHRYQRQRLVVLDIPRLFEGGLSELCDAVVVVSAPSFLQAQRVLSRPHMTAEKFRKILARQMPDAEKCAQADFVVQTGLGHAYTFQEITSIVKACAK